MPKKLKEQIQPKEIDHGPCIDMKGPWLMEMLLQKRQGNEVKWGQSPTMKERRERALKTRCKQPNRGVQVKRSLKLDLPNK